MIKFVENNDTLIAVDNSDGEFHVHQNGSISYLGPNGDSWYVNSSKTTFKASVQALEAYFRDVRLEHDEDAQMEVVKKLKINLMAIENYTPANKSFWQTIVFQAECGHI